MRSHSLLQGIFPTQGSNLGLLHCRQILHHLSHQGSPFFTMDILYSAGSHLKAFLEIRLTHSQFDKYWTQEPLRILPFHFFFLSQIWFEDNHISSGFLSLKDQQNEYELFPAPIREFTSVHLHPRSAGNLFGITGQLPHPATLRPHFFYLWNIEVEPHNCCGSVSICL